MLVKTLRCTAPRPRVIIYARVSKDQNSGRSVGEQLKIGRRIAREREWDIVGEYCDNDLSASQYAKRPREDWPKVEASIAAGEADVLWFWELSRGTRDMVVWAHLAQACQQRQMYIALDEDVFDTTNPDHMKYLNDQMVSAVHEAGRIRKRVLRDATELAEEGRPVGQPGYGFRYVYDPDTGDLVDKVPDPEEAEAVREAARRVLAGEGVGRVVADFNRRRVPTPRGKRAGDVLEDGRVERGWRHSALLRTLRRPAIMGKRSHHGRIIDEGGWEPLIDPQDWWALQRRLQESKRPNQGPPRHGAVKYLLSGIIECGKCGGNMHGVPRYHFNGLAYKCYGLFAGDKGAGHLSRKMQLVNEQVTGLLFDRFSDPDVLEAFTPDPAPGREEVEAQRERLQAERDALYADVAAGRVSRFLAGADDQRIERELADLAARANRPGLDPLVADLARDPQQVWKEWTLEQRRRVLRLVTERIVMLPVGRIGRHPTVEESVEVVWRGVQE